jgi:hypothetical protein
MAAAAENATLPATPASANSFAILEMLFMSENTGEGRRFWQGGICAAFRAHPEDKRERTRPGCGRGRPGRAVPKSMASRKLPALSNQARL